ncbi:hypothetical protein, partial [Escherichia coli]|uniref:hypothetical protein n=1 Tax=Escherichia coli TaxID=562 RepID=UPI0032DAEBC1
MNLLRLQQLGNARPPPKVRNVFVSCSSHDNQRSNGSSTTTMPRRNPTGEGEGPSNIQYSIIDGKALDPLHFSPELVNMLNYQGLLEQFLRIESVVYPNLVHQFYQNMKVKTVNQVPVLTSIVKGVRISFDPPKLARLLSLPLGGVSQYKRHVWIETQEVGFRDYLRYMLGQDEGIALDTRPVKHDLTGEQRILTLLIGESLLPNRNN